MPKCKNYHRVNFYKKYCYYLLFKTSYRKNDDGRDICRILSKSHCSFLLYSCFYNKLILSASVH